MSVCEIPGIDTKPFSLANVIKRRTQCRVVDIYDGDTVTIVCSLHGEYVRMRVRLSGINACEMRGTCEEEKKLAVKAKARVFELLTKCVWTDVLNNKKEMQSFLGGKPCVADVEFGDFDKYGRPLVTLYPLGSSLSVQKCLLEDGLATAYDGRSSKTNVVQH